MDSILIEGFDRRSSPVPRHQSEGEWTSFNFYKRATRTVRKSASGYFTSSLETTSHTKS